MDSTITVEVSILLMSYLKQMRYLGCKKSLLGEIENVLKEAGLLRKGLVLFDAFCGTGTVANHFKDVFRIRLNDNLHFATTFAHGTIMADSCKFQTLGFDPFDFFNKDLNLREGYVSYNYAPKHSGRMYFSDFNANRIDFFRWQIEEWKKAQIINNEEYDYLLASLIESISHISNVAGVYGAYLKSWDPRALKQIKFIPPVKQLNLNESAPEVLSIHHANVEDIISDIDCDILYLDPPYTKNTYSVQYHLLESIVRNDEPEISGITGARPYHGNMNGWSKKYEVEIAFEKVVAKTKAKHVVLSYSSAGLMSKEYILSILKRYCQEKSIIVKTIPYKQYLNSRSKGLDNHCEYIFYGEKKRLSMI